GVGQRRAVAVAHRAGELEARPRRAEPGQIGVRRVGQHVPERADGLAAGDARHHRAPSSGVACRPRSTISNRKPSAHSGWVSSRSNAEIRRARATGSGIDWKIGSIASSGSPGKYIWVTRRAPHDAPNSEKWMWLGRHALGWLRHG